MVTAIDADFGAHGNVTADIDARREANGVKTPVAIGAGHNTVPTCHDLAKRGGAHFSAFEPVFRGRRVPDHPPLDPAEVKTLGLLIADKQAGPFRLELEWISGYRAEP